MKRIALLFLLIVFKGTFADGSSGSSAVLHSMKRLQVTGSVLYIAAHPDDENTRLLTWLSKERNLRTAYLSITRGDGGQNLVGKEQGEMLGLLRTQELLAARRIDGAEQFFTRANDFGYSKNPDETFRIWNKDSILSDMVWVIRNFRPDVLICRFPTTGEGGHGHHTASAILAIEAFDAAADPKRFAWQLKYTSVWQPRRIFWNTFNFGGNNTTSPDQLQIDVGGYNPLLGKSYGEIAAESRSMHKSQGFGSAKTMGSTIEYFKLLKGDSVTKDLFDGIDLTWNRIPGASAISKNIENCILNFNPQSPEKSLTDLINLYKSLQLLPDRDESMRYWKNIKSKEIQNLIFDCAGLWIEVSAKDFSALPGNKAELLSQVICRNPGKVKLNKVTWGNSEDSLLSLPLKTNSLVSFKHAFMIPAQLPYSGPYWLNSTHTEGLFNLDDPLKTGMPENEAALSVNFDMDLDGLNLQIKKPVVYKSVDPIKGEVYRPFEILPPATINFSSKAFAFSNGKAAKLSLLLRSNKDSLNGNIRLMAPSGWQVSPAIIEFNAMNKGHEKTFEVNVIPPSNNSKGFISAEIKIGDVTFSKSIHRVEYDHVPYQFMLADSRAVLSSFDLKQTVLNIGYIPGAGDDVAENLIQVGYNVTLLSQDQLSKINLSSFDAIVTGIRAFNTNEWLQDFDQKLLEYVRQGGNLIIQYNTNNRIGPLTAKIFPYPFTISRERVTDETAEVRILKPEHPAMNYPNKISSDDFKGWIQERGIYFAADIDSSYERILSMNDPGEKPQEGSLIVAKFGKGNFVYSGLVFFRELPAGVTGAYRLFTNLLSLPKNN